jgi:hypothetical protein
MTSYDPPPSPHLPPPTGHPERPVAPYVPQYLPYSSNVVMPFESARPRAKVVIGLLWTSIVLQLLLLWPAVNEVIRLKGLKAGEEEVFEGIGPSLILMIAAGLSLVVVYIVLIVFWMMWVHRLYRNLRALGADGLTYSPGWAVGYWFIPILNLFRPYQVMRETWQASHPSHGGGTSWKAVVAPSAIGAWWAIHLISNVANNISTRVGMRAEDPSVLYGIAWLDLCLIFFDVGVAFVEIWLVRTLTGLQDSRADSAAAAAAAYPIQAEPYYADVQPQPFSGPRYPAR